MSTFLRKYGVTLDLATAGSLRIRIPVRKAGLADFAASGDWTPATGDVKVSKDGGTLANIGTLPTYSNGRWEFILSGTELSARVIEVNVVDSATKAVDDEAFTVETYGNASAMYPGDYTILSVPNVTFGATGGMGPGIVRAGTAQAGGSTSITLDAGASSTTDFFKGTFVLLTGGTGAGQARMVTAYNGTTKVATVSPAWATNPDNTSTFAIVPTPNLLPVTVKTDTISGNFTVQSAVDAATGTVRIIVGDGYETSTRQLTFTFSNYAGPSMTSATAVFRMSTINSYKLGNSAPNVLNASGTVTVDGTTVTVTVILPESLTDDLTAPPNPGTAPTHKYQLIATTAASEDVTLAIGDAYVVRRIEPAA